MEIIKEDIYIDDAEQEEIFTEEDISKALRAIYAIEKDIKEVEDQRDMEIEITQNWANKKLENLSYRKSLFEDSVIAYYKNQRKVNPKYKINTPFGKVVQRKRQPKWIYEDKKIISHLKTNGLDDYIRVKEEVNKSDLKKDFTLDDRKVYDPNGEAVEGIKIEQQEDSITVKAADVDD